jgi:hypothetical protein
MSDRVLRLAGIGGCALAAASIVLLMSERGLGRQFATYDLSAYLAAARRLISGEPLYPQLASGFNLGAQDLYLYPPPVAILFVPLLLLPFPIAGTLWGLALTALAVVVGLAIARGVAPPRRALAVALVLGAYPLEWELAYGNLTLATAALVLVALGARASSWWAATALAFAVGLKLLAVPVAAFLALAGRPRLVARAAALLALVALLSLPFLLRDWIDFVALLARLATGPPIERNLIPAPLSVVPGRLVLLAAAVATLAVAAWRARHRRGDAELAAATAFAVAPFVSAFVVFPYLLFALPLVVLLVLGDRPWWARAAGVGAWLLFQLQGLDQTAAFPSGVLGVALAVAAGLAAAPKRT